MHLRAAVSALVVVALAWPLACRADRRNPQARCVVDELARRANASWVLFVVQSQVLPLSEPRCNAQCAAALGLQRQLPGRAAVDFLSGTFAELVRSCQESSVPWMAVLVEPVGPAHEQTGRATTEVHLSRSAARGLLDLGTDEVSLRGSHVPLATESLGTGATLDERVPLAFQLIGLLGEYLSTLGNDRTSVHTIETHMGEVQDEVCSDRGTQINDSVRSDGGCAAEGRALLLSARSILLLRQNQCRPARQALDLIDEALRLSPEDPHVMRVAAAGRRVLGQSCLAEAERDYLLALSRNPLSDGTLLNLEKFYAMTSTRDGIREAVFRADGNRAAQRRRLVGKTLGRWLAFFEAELAPAHVGKGYDCCASSAGYALGVSRVVAAATTVGVSAQGRFALSSRISELEQGHVRWRRYQPLGVMARVRYFPLSKLFLGAELGGGVGYVHAEGRGFDENQAGNQVELNVLGDVGIGLDLEPVTLMMHANALYATSPKGGHEFKVAGPGGPTGEIPTFETIFGVKVGYEYTFGGSRARTN